jgi:hypothetical protein
MDRAGLEDCMHALGQVYAFYNKEFDDIQRAFWMQFVQAQDQTRFLTALRKYPSEGRYAPKPKDIAEIIERDAPLAEARKALPSKPLTTNCPPKISRAWMFWLSHWYGMNPSSWPKVENVTDEEAEEMLLLINQEARRCNSPQAIPEGHRLENVWSGGIYE